MWMYEWYISDYAGELEIYINSRLTNICDGL